MKLNNSNNRFKNYSGEMKARGIESAKIKSSKVPSLKFQNSEANFQSSSKVEKIESYQCNGCNDRFPSKKEYLAHTNSNLCTSKVVQCAEKKNEKLHFSKIKKLKEEISDNCIIQPCPNLLDGQYRRRRSYTRQHKSTWITTLEKSKYVKCIFQNCYFIAMSLEDMISHFGYCNGDGSFAKFECPHCQGRVTSYEILKIHIERSHKGGSTTNDEKLNCNGGAPTSNSGQSQKNGEESSTGGHCAFDTIQIGKKNSRDEISNLNKCENLRGTKKDSSLFKQPSRNRKARSSSVTFFNDKSETPIESKSCLLGISKGGDSAKEESGMENPEPKKGLAGVETKQVESPMAEKSTEEENSDGRKTGSFGSTDQKRKHSRKRKLNSDSLKDFSRRDREEPKKSKRDENSVEEEAEIDGGAEEPKKRGRKPKKPKEAIADGSESVQEDEVRCGKCDFKGSRKSFNGHNLRKHVGLGWVEGEKPVDLNDEKEVVKLVKLAFKLTKKGVCELCQDVKKSHMGFVTHIQNCGKSEEEKDALKVQCPHCPAKCLKYSMPIHIKLSHCSGRPGDGEIVGEAKEDEAEEKTTGKRRSALRAATKCQEALKEIDETESVETHYVLFEKDSDKFPKICSKLSNIWYKLQRQGEKIPCRHGGCDFRSEKAKEAKIHHFTCPRLPDKVFVCEGCEFYAENESEIQSHVAVHRTRLVKRRKTREGEEESSPTDGEDEEEGSRDGKEGGEEDEDEEEEEDEDDTEGEAEEEKRGTDGSKNRPGKRKEKRKKSEVFEEETKEKKKSKPDVEVLERKNFCSRENLENHRGLPFFGYGLKMTLEEEEEAEMGVGEWISWPQFHTGLSDWLPVSGEKTSGFIPGLNFSISVATGEKSEKSMSWKRFKRFEGDFVQGVPTMFTGGSVRCMSWCKVSHRRMVQKAVKQYLALTTAKDLNHLRNVYDRSHPSSKWSLLQIWDCSNLENAPVQQAPKFSLGIPHEGEIWDLAWFPEDTSGEGPNGCLPRLGLLATASEDGAVRVWSICDPGQLVHGDGPPIFQTDPVAKLVTDEDLEDSCFRLSIGRNGILAGGFANGIVSLWNLKNISSPFSRRIGKCGIVKSHLTIQAHRTLITALTFCPGDNRFITTGGLDRSVKLWDLESPAFPVEEHGKELCLNCVWPKNWPLLVHNFDEVMPTCNRGVTRFVKNLFYDRQHPRLAMDNACLSISFSDWLNALCGSSDSGEIKVRFLKNLICDQKRQTSQTVISSLHLKKLNEEEEKDRGKKSESETEKPLWEKKIQEKSLEEISSRYGLVFGNGSVEEKRKQKKLQEYHPEKFPIRAVNAVSFNPNFKSFTHLAAGYSCGFVRIPCLKSLQSNIYLKSFLQRHAEAEKESRKKK